MTFVYLDHAATSWPKPAPVTAAVVEWYADLGVSAARGDSSRAAVVAERVGAVRAAVARLCGVATDRVVFTSGATESIGIALRGLLTPGDHVVTSAIEHAAVARALVGLRDELGVTFDVVPCDGAGLVDPAAIREALERRPTRLLAIAHASNVTGAVQDVAAMCAAARAAGALSLVDASQTAGTLPLDVGADLVAASAHKGLLGPPGLGVLAARDDVALRPTRFGGTGASRALDRQPTAWPVAFEPGTPNTPAILGLGAALDWLASAPMAALRAHQHAVLDAIAAAIAERAPSARLLRPARPDRHLPILGFVLPPLDPAEIGVLLDAAGIAARTGFHCAPWIHGALGTAASGTARLSPGPMVSADAASRVVDALFP